LEFFEVFEPSRGGDQNTRDLDESLIQFLTEQAYACSAEFDRTTIQDIEPSGLHSKMQESTGIGKK
jgi:hypothetical protein